MRLSTMLRMSLSEILPSGFTTDLRYDMSLENAFAAEERVIAWLLWRERDRSRVKRQEFLIDAEGVEHDALRTFGRLVPEEQQAYGAACLDENRRGLVATPYEDLNLLDTTALWYVTLRLPLRPQEEPELASNQAQAENDDDGIDHGLRRLVFVILDPEVRNLFFSHQPP